MERVFDAMRNLSTRAPAPILALLAWGSIAALGVEPDRPRVAMPVMASVPVIDGVVGEEEWKHAVRNVGLVSSKTGALSVRQGVFWVGSDGRELLVALKTEVPPDGRILTRAVPNGSRDVPATLLDDAVELAVATGRGRPESRLLCLLANARGAIYDWAERPDEPGVGRDLGWRLPEWRFEEQVVDGWWHVEIAVPLESLGLSAGELAAIGGLEVGRSWRRPGEASHWAAGVDGDAPSATMPQVAWNPGAPVVRVLSLAGDPGEPKLEVAVLNPHAEPVAVDVLLSDAWHRDPPREMRRRAVVEPGGEQLFSLDLREGGPEGLHQTEIHVAAGDDAERVFYARRFRWSIAGTADAWTVGDEQKQNVALQFKYYPYHSKVRYRVSVEALGVRDRITGAEAAISRADEEGRPTGEPLWREPVAFEKHVAEAAAEIPELGEGDYVFSVRLAGEGGVPDEPVTEPFVRRTFTWEHNTLGITDEVMPPFEPLEVEGATVRSVLREHRHGAAGLWEAVTSRGQPLLAGPAGWEVTGSQGGGPAVAWPVQGSGWRVTSHRPNAVVGQSDWQAGPVRAHVKTEYDYDGMMLLTLELEPTPDGSLDRLTLNLPLRESMARYMHAVGDGLRHNFAGYTPPGAGVVWDSSRAQKLEIVGTFYPYLWLGDGERGLAWFADTDRDWVLDAETPTIELVREGETVTMRVHFITKPGPLERTHRIVFGLQATPTKPMPKGWRRWVGLKRVEGGRPVRWIGANYYWGGLAYDVYPYKYRFDYFDKMREARETGEPDREFIDAWMRMWEEELAAKGTERYKFLQAHINAGFHAARSSPWEDGYRLFVYTNARGVGFHVPEFAAFQDEWLRYGWFNRNWGTDKAVGYDVSPSASFRDYAVWYYREMLRCFDGVYWDNMFFSAHFDPVVGRAWTDEQGRVHPTMGLFHLRELVKRTAVMLWQESKDLPENRKPPITLSHMTNTMTVPVHSFLNCTMDWEWKYGYDDFQDRFSPDSTVAQTIGRQVGAWPTILAGGHPKPDDPRVEFMYRTRLGVALVHEIQVFDYRPAADVEVYRRLFEFGYGTDECRVFNYWEPGHPVEVEGGDARTLAMARGGAALVVVTDYGEGGSGRVSLDVERLGLAADAGATDLETGEPIERVEPGRFVLEMKKHDFRILRVE
ncbi:MAG: hypothetical protein HQ582_34040 [Planctomycetes bacterium]|nr:hypothetical protein [Planctomycetota bacterium]